MPGPMDVKFDANTSAFKAFEDLTVGRGHNTGTLTVEKNKRNQVVSLACANHCFWNRLANKTKTSMASANELRAVFEYALDEELKSIFSELIKGSRSWGSGEGDAIMNKMREIKDAFRAAIYPSGCQDRKIEFKRKDIRKIILNVNKLRELSVEALMNGDIKDLVRMASDKKALGRVNSRGERAMAGVLYACNKARALVKNSSMGNVLKAGTVLMGSIDPKLAVYKKCSKTLQDKLSKLEECIGIVAKIKNQNDVDIKRYIKDLKKIGEDLLKFVYNNSENFGEGLPDDTRKKICKKLEKLGDGIETHQRELDKVEQKQTTINQFSENAETALDDMQVLLNGSISEVNNVLSKEVASINKALEKQGFDSLTYSVQDGLAAKDAANNEAVKGDVDRLIKSLVDQAEYRFYHEDKEDEKHHALDTELGRKMAHRDLEKALDKFCQHCEHGLKGKTSSDLLADILLKINPEVPEGQAGVSFGIYSSVPDSFDINILKNMQLEDVGKDSEAYYVDKEGKYKYNWGALAREMRDACVGRTFRDVYLTFLYKVATTHDYRRRKNVEAWDPKRLEDENREFLRVIKMHVDELEKNRGAISTLAGLNDELYLGNVDRCDTPLSNFKDSFVDFFEAMFGDDKTVIDTVNEETLGKFLRRKGFELSETQIQAKAET